MRFRMTQGLASDFEFRIILPEWDARRQRQLTPGQPNGLALRRDVLLAVAWSGVFGIACCDAIVPLQPVSADGTS